MKVKKVRWEEKEKDCVRKEGVGVKEGDCRWEGKKEMHKQMLALGIDAISSVSQLMTNSTEKTEEKKE